MSKPNPAPPMTRGGLPLASRLMAVSSVDAEARTVEVVWSTGAVVRRFDWNRWRSFDEALDMDSASIRMDRLNAGAPVLNTHNQSELEDQIGVVERAWLENGEGRALLRISRRPDVEPIWQDIADGIVRNISVGYIVHAYQITERDDGGMAEYKAIDWEPTEISLVPVPADAGAGVRGERPDDAPQYPVRYIEPETPAAPAAAPAAPVVEQITPTPEKRMDPKDIEALQIAARKAEADRQAGIRKLCSHYPQLGAEFERAMLDDMACDIPAARERVLDKLATEQKPISGNHIRTVLDEGETRREAMASAVMHRAGQLKDLPESAREYRGLTLSEMARVSLQKQGMDTRGMAASEVTRELFNPQNRSLMATSDFSVAMSNAVGRVLRRAYETAPRSFSAWARQGRLSDFRPATRVAVSGSLKLEKVNEHGEFKRGAMTDSGEQIQLATYAKSIGITRHTIINDDLDVFGRIPQMYAQAAVAMESSLVYSILTGNPTMGDGIALFDSGHANMAASNAAINVASLGKARGAMRVQKDPGSGEPLNLQPRFLIVPAALETVALQYISQNYIAAKSADYNPFAGSLDLIVEPRLDAVSATSWFLAADPAAVDTVEYAYLDGAEGLQIETRDGFASGSDVQGIEVLAYEDFAAKAIDHRGLYKQPGL